MRLRERLFEAKSPAVRFDILEKALVAQLFRPLESHYAVRFALDTFDRADSGLAIRDVAPTQIDSSLPFCLLGVSPCHLYVPNGQ